MNDDREIQKARAHLTAIAAGLVAKFGAIDAAGLMMGAGTGALLTELGDQKTAEYLRAVADGIESGEGDSTTVAGNA